MTRKEFLSLCLAGAATPAAFGQQERAAAEPSPASAPASEPKAPRPFLECGPMLGHVSSTDARLWIKASGAAKWRVRFGSTSNLADAQEVTGPELPADSAFTGQVVLPNLQPGRRYYYQVLIDGEPAGARPFPSFLTAPEPGRTSRLRFAFTSCVGQTGADAAAGWGEMAARGNIDLLLMLGDNHYADSVEPAKQRALYVEHRNVAGFAALARRTPIYGIWDDHDYGPNDSDGTLEGKELSLRTFREFWPNPGAGHGENPGIYYKFSRGPVDFFMLDVRYHRSPNAMPADGRKTMLGEGQLAWLLRELLASKAAIKFIASGSQWQTHGTEDSWASFRRERDQIFQFIEVNNIEGVILLSGDRHFTAAYQVMGRFMEASAGPIGADNAAGARDTPEEFLKCNVGKLWAVFEVGTAAGAEPQIAIEVWQAGGGLIERRPFSWNEINGRGTIAPSPPLPRPPVRKTSAAPAPSAPTPAASAPARGQQ